MESEGQPVDVEVLSAPAPERELNLEEARLLNTLRDLAVQAARLQEAQARGEITRGPLLNSPKSIDDYFRPLLADLPVEQLRVANLSQSGELLSERLVYQGTVKGFEVRLSELFRQAILDNATRIVVAHNHPSGDLNASPADILMTQRAYLLGHLLDIELRDHVIIARDGYLSMRSNDLGFQVPKNLTDLVDPPTQR